MARKTMDDLRRETKEVLTPQDVCGVLGCDPHWIRVAARQHPERLGFPVIVIGNRTKIPRLAFLRCMEGET